MSREKEIKVLAQEKIQYNSCLSQATPRDLDGKSITNGRFSFCDTFIWWFCCCRACCVRDRINLYMHWRVFFRHLQWSRDGCRQMRERYKERVERSIVRVLVLNTNIPFMESLCDVPFSLLTLFQGRFVATRSWPLCGAAHTQKPMSLTLFVLSVIHFWANFLGLKYIYI
jgi:hypothetical protein